MKSCIAYFNSIVNALLEGFWNFNPDVRDACVFGLSHVEDIALSDQSNEDLRESSILNQDEFRISLFVLQFDESQDVSEKATSLFSDRGLSV